MIESKAVRDMRQKEVSLSELGKAWVFARRPDLDCPEVQILTRNDAVGYEMALPPRPGLQLIVWVVRHRSNGSMGWGRYAHPSQMVERTRPGGRFPWRLATSDALLAQKGEPPSESEWRQ